jgi:toxin ParE1/3/4
VIPVIITPAARADLIEIALQIAESSPARAFTYTDEIEARAVRIGEFPNAGPPRFQWGAGVRITIHGPYLLVYRVAEERVQILRVVHGARDLDALFDAEPLPD